jgi:hypothetical protein
MAKRIDPVKAKAAKQKKIAIGGMVVLVALLAVQGPKTLKMLKGPQPAATAASTTPGGPAPTGPAVGGPAPAPTTGTGTPGAAAAAPAAATELVSVPDSDQAPVVETGQLATFERFSSKDPFTQQAQPVAAPTPAPKSKPDPTKASDSSSGDAGTDSGFTTDGGTTGGSTPSAAPTRATATSIAVNGAAENVTVKVPFPAAEPTFVLVSVAADGKSVQIGVDGGQYADGGDTLKLLLGTKITLQNTADGRRYELELLSIQGFPLPKQKG